MNRLCERSKRIQAGDFGWRSLLMIILKMMGIIEMLRIRDDIIEIFINR